MENLGNKYALAALKDRRATLAGEIYDLKKRLAVAQTQLDHIDACLTIFEYEGDPAAIPNKRPRRRVKLFRQGELGRLIVDALIPSDFEGWTLGNIIIGGPIGLGVDAMTGAVNAYPRSYPVPMTPAGAQTAPSLMIAPNS